MAPYELKLNAAAFARRGAADYPPWDPHDNDPKGKEIHVITHECLEGDTLRCIIKAVPEGSTVDENDYVRIGDLAPLFSIPGYEKPEPTGIESYSGPATETLTTCPHHVKETASVTNGNLTSHVKPTDTWNATVTGRPTGYVNNTKWAWPTISQYASSSSTAVKLPTSSSLSQTVQLPTTASSSQTISLPTSSSSTSSVRLLTASNSTSTVKLSTSSISSQSVTTSSSKTSSSAAALSSLSSNSKATSTSSASSSKTSSTGVYPTEVVSPSPSPSKAATKSAAKTSSTSSTWHPSTQRPSPSTEKSSSTSSSAQHSPTIPPTLSSKWESTAKTATLPETAGSSSTVGSSIISTGRNANTATITPPQHPPSTGIPRGPDGRVVPQPPNRPPRGPDGRVVQQQDQPPRGPDGRVVPQSPDYHPYGPGGLNANSARHGPDGRIHQDELHRPARDSVGRIFQSDPDRPARNADGRVTQHQQGHGNADKHVAHGLDGHTKHHAPDTVLNDLLKTWQAHAFPLKVTPHTVPATKPTLNPNGESYMPPKLARKQAMNPRALRKIDKQTKMDDDTVSDNQGRMKSLAAHELTGSPSKNGIRDLPNTSTLPSSYPNTIPSAPAGMGVYPHSHHYPYTLVQSDFPLVETTMQAFTATETQLSPTETVHLSGAVQPQPQQKDLGILPTVAMALGIPFAVALMVFCGMLGVKGYRKRLARKRKSAERETEKD